jgi:Thioredoxin-like
MPKRILIAAALVAVFNMAVADTQRLGYDPQADPYEQYQAAIAEARAHHKLVLVIAGGDWCRWCHVLNRFVTRNSDVATALKDTFVVVKVYVGDENFNEFFFSQLPPARGAPHFWVISPERKVLASQSTGAFEHGRNGYDKQEFLQFVGRWSHRDTVAALAP